MKSRSAMRGFTLIELVVVIVILGILASFAVPRFIAMEGQARAASAQALAGSLRSASTLAHSMWLASGSPATVSMEGSVVAITFGYPTLASISNTLQDCAALANCGGFTYVPGTGVFTRNGATTPATCTVTYIAPLAVNTAPQITPVTGGC